MGQIAALAQVPVLWWQLLRILKPQSTPTRLGIGGGGSRLSDLATLAVRVRDRAFFTGRQQPTLRGENLKAKAGSRGMISDDLRLDMK